jgi:divalent metal cation (Fe/Co/Zn/Cd) transporter
MVSGRPASVLRRYIARVTPARDVSESTGNLSRTELSARATRLEQVTVAWNVVEVFVTVTLGVAAGSLALVAFGLDSLVEIFASAVVLWHLRGGATSARTQRALWLVAGAFFALGALLIGGAVRDLVAGDRADDSPFGIAYLIVAATAMFTLAIKKRRLSGALGNHPLAHEAAVTMLDGCLASGILLALVVNTAFGWWWADPIAAAGVGMIAIAEGIVTPRRH